MTLNELIADPQLPAYLAKRVKTGRVWEEDGRVWLYVPLDTQLLGSTHHNISFRYDHASNLIIQGHRI